MTFRFEKIGPVDSADITLGDLTIIAGRNNTGKTYLVYALYGFLNRWPGWPGVDAFFRNRERNHPVTAIELPRVMKSLFESDRASVEVALVVLEDIRRHLLDQLVRGFSTSILPAVFNTTPEAFRGARMSVELGSGFSGSVEWSVRPGGQLMLEYNGNELVFAINNDRATSTQDIPRHVLEELIHHLLLRFFCFEFPRPFILPAERLGIPLFYKELDFAKSQLVDLLQKMGRDNNHDDRTAFSLIDKNTSKYAQPIKDNIDYTRNIHEIQKNRGPLAGDKLFDDIEDIMGGYYKASRDAVTFRSEARKKEGFDIPLHLASSSARGLADLYFYLRHKADRNDLLIIDEPESHLDTGNQIALARILVRFVRAGIKVLITTHSDYILKEVNNLIMLSQLDGDNRELQTLDYTESDRLTPSSVRAYVTDHHKLVPATVDEFGIDMPVFDRTIDTINRVSRTLAGEVQAGRDAE